MKTPFAFSASNLRQPKRLACGLIPLLNMLRDHDVDMDAVIAPAGIRHAELIDPAFTITLEQELTIIEQALPAIDAPAASLRLGSYYHLHHFSVLGLAMRACNTLGDVLALIVRYPRLVWGICESAGKMERGVIDFELRAGESRVERFLLERDMACVKILFGEVLQADFNLLEVRFAHEAPDNASAYELFFQCPVQFAAGSSGLRFSVAELERTVPTADPISKEFYEAQCARLSSSMDEPFRYSRLVRDRLMCSTPVPSLEALSESLGIEARSLQRYLKKEGDTFSNLLRDVRLRRATDRLRYSDMAMEAIAEELGFSDAVAFSHAFKEWTGASPRQWRAGERDQK
ncbi:MAG: AraC family transcriptional regulator [Gammaproteobacteria bacterium]|nr:MAG: AraC family transcriptional regulator [Gammaproteobacteria bacterium]